MTKFLSRVVPERVAARGNPHRHGARIRTRDLMLQGDTSIFSMMKERMHWLADRQRVIAENVANADTPNYVARDLAEPDFGEMLRHRSQTQMLSATQTDARHINANSSSGSSGAAVIRRPDFETTPTGNSVVLEEQMIKAAENQMDYQTVTGLYSKSMGLLRIALGKG